MKRSEWVGLEAVMAALWPHAPQLTPGQIEARYDVAGGLDAEAAHDAIKRHSRRGERFAPTPGEVCAAVADATGARPVTPGEALDLMRAAAGRFGGSREAEALRWLAERSPHAARAAIELGWRSFCRERLDDPEVGGAVRARLERSVAGSTAGYDREVREGRVLPLVGDRIRTLGAGEDRSGLRQIGGPGIAGLLPAGPEGLSDSDEMEAPAA